MIQWYLEKDLDRQYEATSHFIKWFLLLFYHYKIVHIVLFEGNATLDFKKLNLLSIYIHFIPFLTFKFSGPRLYHILYHFHSYIDLIVRVYAATSPQLRRRLRVIYDLSKCTRLGLCECERTQYLLATSSLQKTRSRESIINKKLDYHLFH